MSTMDIYRGINLELALREPSGEPLKVRLLHLGISREDNRIAECTATFSVGLEQYAHISQVVLFGLDPNRRGPMTHPRQFVPSENVDIEADLTRELVDHLHPTSLDAKSVAEYLLSVPADSRLLSTGSWTAVAVSQEIGGRRNGYRMPRAGVDLMRILSQAQVLTGDMESATDSLLAQARDSIPIFAATYDYFQQEGWDFALLADAPGLRMRYRGDHGEWDCLVETRDDDDQFVFYSIFPSRVPAGVEHSVVEFLCRANAGLVIGNFELDLAAGQARFKTSLDVMGASITRALIDNAVRWNLLMMDEYLPGLVDVVEGKHSAIEAIAVIENR